MCLTKLSPKDEKAALSKLPNIFPCWKIINKSGHCEYDIKGLQPKFTRKLHIAQSFPTHRKLLNYIPGFHAFLKKPHIAFIYQHTFKVVKCWANKEDIIILGTPIMQPRLRREQYPLSIAVSKIRRK